MRERGGNPHLRRGRSRQRRVGRGVVSVHWTKDGLVTGIACSDRLGRGFGIGRVVDLEGLLIEEEEQEPDQT
jgi:hypothetical protein